MCIKRWGHSSLLTLWPNLHGAQVPSPQQGEKRKEMWRKACPPGAAQPSALQKSPKACHLRCLWRCHCSDRTANGLSNEARQACPDSFLRGFQAEVSLAYHVVYIARVRCRKFIFFIFRFLCTFLFCLYLCLCEGARFPRNWSYREL